MKSATDKLPVMVWIYGGGFLFGASSLPLYDGKRLAQRGVVLVSIAYRIGPLGFMGHPALTHEGRGSSGNYGLADQIAGLKWVQSNISRQGRWAASGPRTMGGCWRATSTAATKRDDSTTRPS